MLNYAIQDFFQTILPLQIIQEQIRKSIVNVLKAIAAKYVNIGYVQGMNFVANFLLTLLDEEGAFRVYSYLIDLVLPEKLYQNNQNGDSLQGYFVEAAIIQKLMEKYLLQVADKL